MADVRCSDQFLCSICLEVFTEPVSTPCGHNFCKTCINQAWAVSDPCFCPMCKEVFNIKPELKTNTSIKEMISELRLKKKSQSMEDIVNFSGVPCDNCSHPKLKAVKSCLVCLASYCDTHLQSHRTVLKRHQLIEPVWDPEGRMCPKHNKPLELFCRTDHSCICTSCPNSEHQNHEIVPLKDEVHLRRFSLQQTQTETQDMMKQRQMRIQNIGRSLELSQEAVHRERAVGLQAFTAMMQSVQERQEKFIEDLQEKHRETQKQAQDLIKELEQEISELEKRSFEVEQLSRSEDHLRFIQSSTSLKPAAALKDWSTVSFETDIFEGSAARALAELDKTLTQEFQKLFKTELNRVQQFAVDVTLDPNTAHPRLVLSEDLKQVYHTDVWKKLPDTPQRFNECVNVLGKESFASGRFYFEVQVKEKTNWTLGVVQESINRKGHITLSPQNGYWTICLRNGDQYIVKDSPPVYLCPERPLQKVGVFVDYSDGVVSFYDVDFGDLIYSFTDCCFKDKLLPYFGPCPNVGGTNTSPLVITPVCLSLQSIQ